MCHLVFLPSENITAKLDRFSDAVQKPERELHSRRANPFVTRVVEQTPEQRLQKYKQIINVLAKF